MRDTYIRIERIKFLKRTLEDLERQKERALLSGDVPRLLELRKEYEKVKKLLDEEREAMK